MKENLIQIGEQRASSTSRWLACLGSAIICGGETSKSDEFSLEGTAAHLLLDFCLCFEASPEEELGSTIAVEGVDIEVTADMVEAVGIAYRWIKENLSADFVTEKKMNGAGIGLPLWTGHVDIQDYDEAERMLTVVDYKHGAGVRVRAYENLQGLSYAAMSMTSQSFGPVDKVRIVIIQPRIGDDPVDEWLTDFGRVAEHIRDVSEATRTIEFLAENPHLVKDRLRTGDHCQFCPAILKCPAIHEPLQEVALAGFDDHGFLQTLSADEVAHWYTNVKRINKWVEALKKRARELADTNSLPGWKLADALANRQWVDEEKAKLTLEQFGIGEEELIVKTPDKMLSPSRTESLPLPDDVTRKELKEIVCELTHRAVKGLTLVPDSDPRENKIIDAFSEFDDEEEV